jgi:hypothetical protein
MASAFLFPPDLRDFLAGRVTSSTQSSSLLVASIAALPLFSHLISLYHILSGFSIAIEKFSVRKIGGVFFDRGREGIPLTKFLAEVIIKVD